MRYLLPALLLLPGAAFADILVLKDGTVVECKIRDLKGTASVFTVIAEMDEEGTIKQFPSTEIRKEGNAFALYRGKTSWERRAEYRKEYDRRRESLKETWEAHVALGKWCRSHLLSEPARDHFASAYRIRSEKAPATVEERLKLARWCEKDLGLEKEAETERKAALDLRRLAVREGSAAERVGLGRWAETVDLPEDALAEYEAALAREPGNADAAAALKKLKESPEFAARRLVTDLLRDRRAWKVTVALQDAATRETLDAWKKRMEELSALVFTLTEGQFLLAEVEIEDKVLEGTIVVEKGKLDWKGLDGRDGRGGVLAYCRGSGAGGYEVHVPGQVAVSVLAHELFHGAFGLPDEYDREPACDCLMKSAPNPPKLCDRSSHAGPGADCWSRILSRHRAVQHPNPAWKKGELDYGGIRLAAPPPVRVTIIDN